MGEGGSGRPRVLLVDADARGRLRLTSALRDRFDVQAHPPGESLLRTVRHGRLDVVVLVLGRGRASQGLRTCHALKTDGRKPPRVALIDRFDRSTDPAQAMESCAADGYLGGEPTPEGLVQFIDAVLAGRSPTARFPGRRGLLDRLRGR